MGHYCIRESRGNDGKVVALLLQQSFQMQILCIGPNSAMGKETVQRE
jgi:hypothetical protein